MRCIRKTSLNIILNKSGYYQHIKLLRNKLLLFKKKLSIGRWKVIRNINLGYKEDKKEVSFTVGCAREYVFVKNGY